MINLKFKLNKWQALPCKISEIDNWQDSLVSNKHDFTCSFDLIPPMQRRRMSHLSKLAVQTSLMVTQDHQIDYGVFSSRHGELFRSAQLIQNILQGEDASPMAFSQSVHNTASGLFTIIGKRTIPVTSISATADSFHNALIEACAYIENNPSSKVLVVDFDEPLPELYQQYATMDFPRYVLGLIISAGDEYQITGERNVTNNHDNVPQAIQVMSRLHHQQRQWKITSKRHCWQWIAK